VYCIDGSRLGIATQQTKKHIIFVDETATFFKTKQFAEYVRGADNYFVIVTRDDLPQLPYSVDEIYGLRNVSDTSKYKSFKKIYNETYNLYNLKTSNDFKPDLVITEDTNSGYECFCMIYGDICKAAGGKSRIYRMLRTESAEHILVIVDGAAFGAEIGKVHTKNIVYRYSKMGLGEAYKTEGTIRRIMSILPEQIR